MPVTMNETEIMSDDGKFTDSFSPEMLGEDYKDSKVFETTPDLPSLMKAFADTKSAVGKKLEGVIQKPDEKATEQEKADYRTSLLEELGAPEKKEDYEFPRPEGVEYSEEREGLFRDFFFEKSWPVGMAKELTEKFNEIQMVAMQARLDAEQKEFEDACKEQDARWTGDAKIANNRLAFKAIMRFGSDDLKKVLKEGKINDDVANHQKWNDLGFSPAQREVWYNIGNVTDTDKVITGDGSPAQEEESGVRATAKKLYNHPTSVKAREARE